jgi:signal transduction histidine kinase
LPSHELVQSNARLARTVGDLRALMRCVAHDLKAPLHTISGFAGMLQLNDTALMTQQGRRRLNRIMDCAEEMDRIIDQTLLSAAASREEASFGRIDLQGEVGSLLPALQEAFPDARISVGRLPAIMGDPLLVRQVFANLLENALKFSARSAQPQVEVGSTGAGPEPVFFVRDNGIGFPPEVAGLLFEPFRRFSDSSYAGDGIGLAIALHFLQRHGGWILSESRPALATTFTFAFGPHGRPRPFTSP